MCATPGPRRQSSRATSAILFLSLFAAQSGVIAMSPVLAEVARDLGISTSLAGQLRTITGLTAGVTALVLGRIAHRVGLGRQLLLATGLLALGSLASAAAPSFALLALAQAPVGVAVAILTTAGTLAAAEWVPAEQRTNVLSWALIGQPAAWIVGMPLTGIVGEQSWRCAWLALPLAAALVAGAALLHRRRNEQPALARPARLGVALSDRQVVRWLGSELLANTAWAATLVYAGALFVEAHDASTTSTGLMLAVGATAYIAGNRLARELVPQGSLEAVVVFALALAVTSVSFGALRSSVVVSAALFSAAAFAAGGRTLVSSAYGLSLPAELRPTVMGSRAATMQFGYFAGSSAGGLALLLGGYTAYGVVIGMLFLAAAVVLASPPRAARTLEARRPSLGARLVSPCAP